MSARLRHDERGVSEVIGYLLSFFMSFILLTITLVGFDIIAGQETENATRTHFQDIANRVASAVLTTVDVGAQRAGSTTTANSEDVLFQQRLRVPALIRGQHYRVALNSHEVTVTNENGDISESAELFNLIVGTCSVSEPVCELGGASRADAGYILVKYEFKAAGISSIGCSLSGMGTSANCIRLG